MEAPDRQYCLVLRPTVKDFSRPFVEFIKDVCQEHPGVPMFKVVPPKGWKPCSMEPRQILARLIETPIKQNVVGSGGAFKCVLEEYRKLTVADMKKLAESDKYRAPPPGRDKDEWLERQFWSSVSINPPIYGADTPDSFFDKNLRWGWNLRNLGDLLSDCDVPSIPGVTSPMVYFGMWKSFFSWHVEDVDLYSINYLHSGAPKVWYCVPPGEERKRFEHLARQTFPHDADKCRAFLRHKEFLISPKTLRSHGIKFVQARQEAGEFIVLNAGAYHCGYNLGFNCAEAVNFATSDWIELGETASTCTCRALEDPVTLDMKLFRRASKRLKATKGGVGLTSTPSPRESLPSRSSSDEHSSECENSESDEDTESEGALYRLAAPSLSAARGQIKDENKDRLSKINKANALSKTPLMAAKKVSRTPVVKHAILKEVHLKTAAESVADSGCKASQDSAQTAKLDSSQTSEKAKYLGTSCLVGPAEYRSQPTTESGKKRQRVSDSTAQGRTVKVKREMSGASPVQRAVQWMRKLMPGHPVQTTSPETSVDTSTSYEKEEGTEERKERPAKQNSLCYAVVGEDERSGRKFFHLVEKVKERSSNKKLVVVRWLKLDPSDGVYRSTSETWEEAQSALLPVRTQEWHIDKDKPSGIRLLTLKYKILDTDLKD